MGKLRVYCLKTLKKLSIYPLGNTPSAPSVCSLNRITRKDRYPLLHITDLLDALQKAWIYTKIDLRSAYNLVCIAKGDEWKTAFWTHFGLFKMLVMPFGLCNALATFQRFMQDIFTNLLDVYVVIYLDDILIYSNDPSKHQEHVKEVLHRLRKHRLYAKAEKCEWSTQLVKYLGFRLGPDGLSMDLAKVQTILDWPEPHKVKDIQAFLGFANFYRRFIHDYSATTCQGHSTLTLPAYYSAPSQGQLV